ncbi:MAG: FdhD protein [Paracoccaceae bacterium]|jgi:FdhD protein
MEAARHVMATPLGQGAARPRALPEETAVAFSYDGVVHAVMMASPADLVDFALGFSISEGIVADPGGIEDIEIVDHPDGLEARMWLRDAPGAALSDRRRTMAGPVGCGLCGIESLAEALRPLPVLPAGTQNPAPWTARVSSCRGWPLRRDASAAAAWSAVSHPERLKHSERDPK